METKWVKFEMDEGLLNESPAFSLPGDKEKMRIMKRLKAI
jgi:hypothetical protein